MVEIRQVAYDHSNSMSKSILSGLAALMTGSLLAGEPAPRDVVTAAANWR